MPNRYSNLVSPIDGTTSEPGTTTGLSGHLGPGGLGGSAYKHRQGRMDFTGVPVGAQAATNIQDNDVWAMVPILSSYRLYEVVMTCTAAFNLATSITVDIGLYEMTPKGELGPEIDLDLFASAITIDAAAVARVDQFLESTTLAAIDRGKRAWELAAIGAAIYTEDPDEQWYVCYQVNAVGNITTAGEIMLEVFYKDD